MILGSLLTALFGTKHQREAKKLWPAVEEIDRLALEMQSLSDQELQNKTAEFKKAVAEGRLDGREDRGMLDDILPEAYAVVKEACRRHLGRSWKVVGIERPWDMVPFDVQLLGGIVLHQGKIAEMATGEGKTLVAIFPLYLNALTGRGVHLVTVNDYLARRDSQWMGEILRFLGLTVGCLDDTEPGTAQRRAAYQCDVVYGTNNEFGFDYLRDNMAGDISQCVQREHYYAIVDEVDSVLVDEARTPLIISGPVEHSTHRYDEMVRPVAKLVEGQTLLVNRLVAEAERLLGEGGQAEAGVKLLQAHRGAPKNKRLLKLLKEGGHKKQMQQTETEYLRDKKLHELDEELFFSIDERSNVVDLTEKGRQALSPREPELFVIPDLLEEIHRIDSDETLNDEQKAERRRELEGLFTERSEKNQNIAQLLRAYSLFEKDVDYVVSDNKVLIVDEFTGRLMPGRRYSDGLHQALEAKEGVAIERETQTLATISIQNYFRLYSKLGGMTGTAVTEAGEFYEIYKLEVVSIPTNRPVRRQDCQDVIYRTKREKYNAVIDEIAELNAKGRPILVGTVSVEVSETLSRMLARRGIRHSVLNAKHHQREAEIVALAGQAGAVTIATNMAGRGTDIKLGAGVVRSQHCRLVQEDGAADQCPHHDELRCREFPACGLHIIGTERHEARRIDRQLRGRSGRQGDPGSSRFYLSLEDDLMRLFGSERIAGIMERLGAEEGEVLTHPLLTRQIQTAQKRVEAHNFDIRKHLLEYDDVMNKQRESVYRMRRQALEQEDLSREISEMMERVLDAVLARHTDEKEYPEGWNWDGLREELRRHFLLDAGRPQDHIQHLTVPNLRQLLWDSVREHYRAKERMLGPELMRRVERYALLQTIDENWREHLHKIDMIKEGIGLRAYGQKDPLVEYKRESYGMFVELLEGIDAQATELLFKAHPMNMAPPQPRPVSVTAFKPDAAELGRQAPEPGADAAGGIPAAPGPKQAPLVKQGPRVGRNDPCPCGSGKKYKKCCGASA
jgi:preprotein translocase subunit SecA